ncbi:MBL fold metallo-hydrolase [Candidatus Thiothrix sp. Deng01]|uniref:MBL fold metallo-hydrolase n=1 Tax=Candidatus Thiothrix phosphatis TaxID=3112415 RepID=A0ABU6D125_9GAMM|nr:MBL fold metallo-hydrolase [Candidatus Thiothrix sp. Deng01]MEB4592487.1 MBL fold metallo-hydrolase [Candidatus Thiothrix sp. Deng01]
MAARYQDLGNGIYCIDTDLYRPQMAACYLVREGDAAAFIDTGTFHTIPLLMEVLAELGLSAGDVRYVIPTHVHLDHAGGAGELMARCPDASLIVHPKGAPHMIDPSRLRAGAIAVYGEEGFRQDYGKLVPVPEQRVIVAADGYAIDLNGRTLSFYDTPGHANHHGCIFDHKSRHCFTGDTFGIAYREFDTANGPWIFAPTTPVAFSPEQWHASLDKLEGLQASAMLLTHYGRVTDVAGLMPKLRASIDSLSRLAIQQENAPEGRIGTLKKQIFHTWLEEIAGHGSTLPEGDIRDLLAVDGELNAQGLDVWLQRRAKAKT